MFLKQDYIISSKYRSPRGLLVLYWENVRIHIVPALFYYIPQSSTDTSSGMGEAELSNGVNESRLLYLLFHVVWGVLSVWVFQLIALLLPAKYRLLLPNLANEEL